MENTSLTPAALTAMIGIYPTGSGLAPVPNYFTATTNLSDIANVVGVSNAQISQAATTLSSLTTLKNHLFASGPGGFVQILTRVQGHVKKSIQLKTINNNMAATGFNDLGSGVTSMSSMTDQGLTATFGNTRSAGTVISRMGTMFTLSDPTSIGTGGGFVEVLINQKLANQIGLIDELIAFGVDTADIRNPIYEERIMQVLARIIDPVQIAKVTTKLQLTPYKPIASLADFMNINLMISPASIPGLTANLAVIGQKFTDMNASFPNVAVASSMLNNIKVPNTAQLNANTTSLSSMVSGFASSITAITGTGTGPDNLPTVNDFVHVVAGGKELAAVAANPNVQIATMQALSNVIAKSNSLFTTANINLLTPPTVSSDSVMGFVTGLHAIGADTSSSNISATISSMVTSDKWGEAITATLAEGKNIASFTSVGIKPLRF